jgi:hypothetical protein
MCKEFLSDTENASNASKGGVDSLTVNQSCKGSGPCGGKRKKSYRPRNASALVFDAKLVIIAVGTQDAAILRGVNCGMTAILPTVSGSSRNRGY